MTSFYEENGGRFKGQYQMTEEQEKTYRESLPSHIVAKRNGSRRVQFITEIKLALDSHERGASDTETITSIRRALKVLERK